MAIKHEFQENDPVRVLGASNLVHVNGGGMQTRREFRHATIMRRDEQHGRGQWRVVYQDGHQDVVAEARLEPVEDDDGDLEA